jgi:HlyD family secretion protein
MSLAVRIRRLAIWGVLLALLAASIAYAFRPQPVLVDLAFAEVGMLRVTVDEEGETRVRDVYTLHAPLSGKLLRIKADAGDAVQADLTELARIEPASPPFLDVRAEAEQRAVIDAAKAARDLTNAEVERAQADLEFAVGELARARRLIEHEAVSQRILDDAVRAHHVATANLATAKAALNMRENELVQARTRLLTRQEIEQRGEVCECVPVTAPVSGVVLRILRRSEGVVEAGAPLLEIGDPVRLEIVADLLSEDAVRIEPGQKALITGWGGPELAATIRRIEPFGRTKVSALGIEEQRVDVVLDLTGSPERWRRLGHGFRVDVAVILFEGKVLKLPLGAVFRNGSGWAVFTVEERIARLRSVEIGARNSLEIEIASGLTAGQRVVLYPGDRIDDGVAVVER